jgi:hypothetical protein
MIGLKENLEIHKKPRPQVKSITLVNPRYYLKILASWLYYKQGLKPPQYLKTSASLKTSLFNKNLGLTKNQGLLNKNLGLTKNQGLI